MTLIFAIAQGIGLASAAGVRPFLPALLACALARGDLGLSFDGTDFAFMEETWFLIVLFAGTAVAVLIQRRVGIDAVETGPVGAALAGIGIGLGALLFAGSLADHGYDWWPGIVGGVAAGLLASAATRPFFARVRSRLQEGRDREAVGLYAEGTGLLLAGVAVAVPPVAFLYPFAFAWLLAGARRREGGKYAGLRVLSRE